MWLLLQSFIPHQIFPYYFLFDLNKDNTRPAEYNTAPAARDSEGIETTSTNVHEKRGPRAAPKSNPVAREAKEWEPLLAAIAERDIDNIVSDIKKSIIRKIRGNKELANTEIPIATAPKKKKSERDFRLPI